MALRPRGTMRRAIGSSVTQGSSGRQRITYPWMDGYSEDRRRVDRDPRRTPAALDRSSQSIDACLLGVCVCVCVCLGGRGVNRSIASLGRMLNPSNGMRMCDGEHPSSIQSRRLDPRGMANAPTPATAGVAEAVRRAAGTLDARPIACLVIESRSHAKQWAGRLDVHPPSIDRLGGGPPKAPHVRTRLGSCGPCGARARADDGEGRARDPNTTTDPAAPAAAGLSNQSPRRSARMYPNPIGRQSPYK